MGKTKRTVKAGDSLFEGTAVALPAKQPMTQAPLQIAAAAEQCLDITGSPINLIALVKSIKEDQILEARDCLTPGNFVIDSVLHIRGTLSVGEDHEAMVVMAANPWALLAMALNRLNGVTIRTLIEAADQFAQGVADTSGEVLKEQARAAMEEIKGKTRQTRRGQVRPRISIYVLKDFSVKQNATTKPARKRTTIAKAA